MDLIIIAIIVVIVFVYLKNKINDLEEKVNLLQSTQTEIQKHIKDKEMYG